MDKQKKTIRQWFKGKLTKKKQQPKEGLTKAQREAEEGLTGTEREELQKIEEIRALQQRKKELNEELSSSELNDIERAHKEETKDKVSKRLQKRKRKFMKKQFSTLGNLRAWAGLKREDKLNKQVYELGQENQKLDDKVQREAGRRSERMKGGKKIKKGYATFLQKIKAARRKTGKKLAKVKGAQQLRAYIGASKQSIRSSSTSAKKDIKERPDGRPKL